MSTASGQHDPHLATPAGKPRARAVGLKYRGTPGPHNAITDVPGVEVGYQTLIEGDSVRTGVTAIHPRGKHNPGDPLAAGHFSLNGNGEMTGRDGHRSPALPRERLTKLLASANRG